MESWQKPKKLSRSNHSLLKKERMNYRRSFFKTKKPFRCFKQKGSVKIPDKQDTQAKQCLNQK